MGRSWNQAISPRDPKKTSSTIINQHPTGNGSQHPPLSSPQIPTTDTGSMDPPVTGSIRSEGHRSPEPRHVPTKQPQVGSPGSGWNQGKMVKTEKKTWKLKPKHKLVFKVRLNIILIVSYSDIGVDSQPQETLLKPYEILLFSHPSLSWNELTWREHDAWKRRHVQFGRQPSRAHIDTCHFIADSTLKCTHSSNAIDLWITCAVYPLVN